MDHTPVLTRAVLETLAPAPGEVFLDCTVGLGGHAAAIIPRLAPGGRYIALDLDPGNVQHARDRLVHDRVIVTTVHANFLDARSVLDGLGIDRVDGLLADLGFASPHVEDPRRGFSFARDGPLDMRLNPHATTTAADLVNRLPERDLADLIFKYGEERFSRRIARKIAEQRAREPILTTWRLSALCAAAQGCSGRRVRRIDPATRTFQALRIAVNDELGNLEGLLAAMTGLLKSGGRAAIISFHSLEDRLVKHAFARFDSDGRAQRLTKKPLTADEAEIEANPRSRSAKLRAIRWIEQDTTDTTR